MTMSEWYQEWKSEIIIMASIFQVERIELKDVRLPHQLQRAMAAEAEATREARAKVIAAEGMQIPKYLFTFFGYTFFVYICFSGEQKASRALKEASDIISESPAALQLRYLQTLTHISAEKNSTIIFPLPIEIMNSFLNRNG